MGTLLDPVNRTTRCIKWGLVTHTAAMFLFVTIFTVLAITPSSFIDNREYPGDYETPPGPMGYKLTQHSNPLSALPGSMFYLNQWLADGLLASSVPNSVVRTSYATRPPSSIAVTLSMPRTTGPLPSRA